MEETTRTCTETESMARYLDPTNDVAFKKLFGSEELLISFLNATLDLKVGHKIKKIQFLPKDQAPLIKDAKSTILDIKCTDEEGKQYIVEMQNRKVPSFVKRAQLYAAHSYVSQLSSGDAYTELKPIILLCIANHILFPGKSRVISHHQTLDKHTSEHDLQELSYVFIELPKFDKEEQDLVTVQDKWLYFFKNWGHSQEIPSTIQEKELIKAYHAMEKFNWTKNELEAYLKAQIALTDDFIARQVEREEGRAEGEAKGRVEGEAKGRAEGKVEMARHLLKNGVAISLISLASGLSEEEIRALI